MSVARTGSCSVIDHRSNAAVILKHLGSVSNPQRRIGSLTFSNLGHLAVKVIQVSPGALPRARAAETANQLMFAAVDAGSKWVLGNLEIEAMTPAVSVLVFDNLRVGGGRMCHALLRDSRLLCDHTFGLGRVWDGVRGGPVLWVGFAKQCIVEGVALLLA